MLSLVDLIERRNCITIKMAEWDEYIKIATRVNNLIQGLVDYTLYFLRNVLRFQLNGMYGSQAYQINQVN